MSANPKPTKPKRTRNFTQDMDRSLRVILTAAHGGRALMIINATQNHAAAKTAKEKVWADVSARFAQSFPDVGYSAAQLKDRWRNMKFKDTKKVDAANFKKAENRFKALCSKTGGGTGPKPLEDVSIDDESSM